MSLFAQRIALFESYCKKDAVDGVDIEATIGSSPITLTCLTNPSSQLKGYSEHEPKDNHGLLFIFTEEQPLNFWMKGVNFPLDIMYFDLNRELIDWHSMEPEDKKSIYTSSKPAMFAVEVPKGWCETSGISTGCKLNF